MKNKDVILVQNTRYEDYPDKKESNKKGLSELDKLKNELKDCIEKEEYEKAAVIRDKIKKLEKQEDMYELVF